MSEKTRDIPLSELTLRKYENPYALEERELVRKVCLSLGLLQYGDSRDVIVDIFHVLLKHSPIAFDDMEQRVKDNRTNYQLAQTGIASSNIRRQNRRLKEAFLVEKFDGVYRVVENAPLVEIFEEKVEQYILNSTLKRVKEYLQEVEKLRPKQPDPARIDADPEAPGPGIKRIVLPNKPSQHVELEREPM